MCITPLTSSHPLTLSHSLLHSALMSLRAILSRQRHPSCALVACTPWTRWLVELGAASVRGCVVADHVEVRKVHNAAHIITGTEVELLETDPVPAQRYLDAAAWWFQRAPLDVARLPVTLIAHEFDTHLARVPGWRVTSLDISESPSDEVDLRLLCRTMPDLTELKLSDTSTCDLTALASLHNLETLDVSYCRGVDDLTPLQHLRHLKALRVNGTAVATLAPLRGMASLQLVELNACANLRDLGPLRHCRELHTLDISVTPVSDVSPLAELAQLAHLSAVGCLALCDFSPLRCCGRLKVVNVSATPVSDVGPLGDLPWLETVNVDRCRALLDVSPLRRCLRLKTLYLAGTPVTDLSCLAGLENLELIVAANSQVNCVDGLEACPKLTRLLLTGTPSSAFSRFL